MHNQLQIAVRPCRVSERLGRHGEPDIKAAHSGMLQKRQRGRSHSRAQRVSRGAANILALGNRGANAPARPLTCWPGSGTRSRPRLCPDASMASLCSRRGVPYTHSTARAAASLSRSSAMASRRWRRASRTSSSRLQPAWDGPKAIPPAECQLPARAVVGHRRFRGCRSVQSLGADKCAFRRRKHVRRAQTQRPQRH